MEKYPLKDKVCFCGLNLSGKTSIVTGEKDGQLMGACPQCGRALPLEAKKTEAEPEE